MFLASKLQMLKLVKKTLKKSIYYAEKCKSFTKECIYEFVANNISIIFNNELFFLYKLKKKVGSSFKVI